MPIKPYFTYGVSASDRDLITSTTTYSGVHKRYFSSLDAEIFIGGERIRFLKKIIKRNIDFNDLFYTVAIRYRTIFNILREYLLQDISCIEKYGRSRDHIQFMIKNKCEKLLINQDN